MTELLKLRAEIDAEDLNGWTPLMIAASRGYNGIAEDLFAHGSKLKELIETKEDQYATAAIFRIAARYSASKEDRSKAIRYYRIAADRYRAAGDYFGSEARKCKRENFWAVAGPILLQALASTASSYQSRYQAKYQAKEMAQFAALKHAYDTGTGTKGYFGSYGHYYKAFSANGRSSMEPQYGLQEGKNDNSSSDNICDVYSDIGEECESMAEECSRITVCYERSTEGRELTKCLKEATKNDR